jgi:hypothetical protein
MNITKNRGSEEENWRCPLYYTFLVSVEYLSNYYINLA